MKLDVKDMDKLDVSKFSYEEWNVILKNINEQKDILFNEDNINKQLKSKIKINTFLFQNIKDDPNASVEKVDDNEYDIIIGKKLITLLLQQSYNLVDNEYIFSDIKEDIHLKHLIAQVYFYIWIDFICLHEFSHIVRSHLNGNTKNFKFTDDYLENKENLFYEIDADRFAMIMTTRIFSCKVNEIKRVINRNEKEIIENYLMSIAYIFDLFYLIEGENVNTNSHPSPFQRIHIVLAAFCESIKKENLFSIEFDKLDKLTNDIFEKFVLRHGEEYGLSDDCLKHYLEGVNLLNKYYEFQKNNELDGNQLLK